jgi:hypothetical protein
VRFAEELPRFAFEDAMRHLLASRGSDLDRLREAGPWRALLDAFLSPEGLDAARAPKGLLLFHREAGECRTAFEEHLIEACALSGPGAAERRLA